MVGLLELVLVLGSLEIGGPSQRYGDAILQPAEYASPSGTHVLHVNPTHRLGAGPAEYRLTKDGQEVWATKLPVALWKAAVTDSGYTGGFAYSRGERGRPERGDFHVVLLDPAGKVLLNESWERKDGPGFHSSPDPKATAVVAHEDLDRLIVEIASREGPTGRTWWVFRLSTGERLEDVQPEKPISLEEREYLRLDSFRALPSTPLLVAYWRHNDYRESSELGYSRDGSVFSLLDENGKNVWVLERPGDVTIEGDEKADDRLEKDVRERGAILDVDAPGLFDLWFPSEEMRARFRAFPTGKEAEPWSAELVSKEDFSPHEPEPVFPKIELSSLGSVPLVVPGKKKLSPIYDVYTIGFTEEGNLELIRRESEERVFSILRLDAKGEVELETRVGPVLPEVKGTVKWFDAGGDLWWVAVSESGRGAMTRLSRVNARTGFLEPLEDLDCPSLLGKHTQGLVPREDGGFVALTATRYKYTFKNALRAFDALGRLQWSVEEDHPDPKTVFSPLDLTLTRDGTVVVLDVIRKELQLFSSDGKHLRNIDLEVAWGRKPRYPIRVRPDGEGGVYVLDDDKLWRTSLDGELIEVLMPTERGSGRFGLTMFEVAPDGSLWSSDRSMVFQVSEEEAPERFGTLPSSKELQAPNTAAIDRLGRILIQDYRSRSWHVFDRSGKYLFVCELEAEGKDAMRFSTGVAADDEGAVYIPGGRETHLRFSSEGERAGFADLYLGEARFGPGGDYVASNPFGEELYWLTPAGTLRAKIDRRPDQKWFRTLSDFHVANDGSTLAVLDTGAGFTGEPGTGVAVFDGDGQGRFVVDLNQFSFGRVAASRDWVVAGGFGADQFLIDVEDGSVRELSLGLGEGKDSSWTWGFSPDGRELWGVEARELTLHRFRMPERGQ